MKKFGLCKLLALIVVFTIFTSFSRGLPVSRNYDSEVVDEEEEYEEEELEFVDTKRDSGASNSTDDTKIDEYYDDEGREESEDPTSLDFESLDDEYESDENNEEDEDEIVDEMSLLRTLILEKQI